MIMSSAQFGAAKKKKRPTKRKKSWWEALLSPADDQLLPPSDSDGLLPPSSRASTHYDRDALVEPAHDDPDALVKPSFKGFGQDGGTCPPKAPGSTTPRASEPIRRLQAELRALAKRVGESALAVDADGLIGPKTVAATNRALAAHAGAAPATFRTGQLTRAQIVSFAPQLASYVAQAPTPVVTAAAAAAAAGRAAAASYAATPKGAVMPAPAYYPPTAYAPVTRGAPPYYPQSRAAAFVPAGYSNGAGGMPTDHANLDVKAFIPAQYQHVNISPVMGMFMIAGTVAIILLIRKHKIVEK